MTELEKIRLSNQIKLKRQKWGVRRFQNDDGTLTDEGKARYFRNDDQKTETDQVTERN